MSDEDPKNIQLVMEEIDSLKSNYPEMSFFMIETHGGTFIKHEISQHGLKSHAPLDNASQLDLFNPVKHKG
jgi:hypothetical protein